MSIDPEKMKVIANAKIRSEQIAISTLAELLTIDESDEVKMLMVKDFVNHIVNISLLDFTEIQTRAVDSLESKSNS